ncbi:hypothetical protein LCGC14_2604680, partial [marine sediment metagenome]
RPVGPGGAAAQRFQKLFREMPVGVALLDRRLHIGDCNATFQSQIGEPDAIGRPFLDFVQKDQKIAVADELESVLDGRSSAKSLEARFTGPDETVASVLVGRMQDDQEAATGLVLVVTDPTNVRAIDDISIMTERDVRPAVASPDDIQAVIAQIKKLDTAVADAIEEGEEEEEESAIDLEVRESAENAPVVKLVNVVIAQAVGERASDIHFEPRGGGKGIRVRYRVDGMLHDATTVPRKMVSGVTSRLKIMGGLDIAERRMPQDGRVSLTVDGHPVDIRVASLPSVNGEKIVLRLLDKEKALLTLEMLGMQEDVLERFTEGFRSTYGAVLVTGPTGSGKTTSLYAALNAINTPEKNIITVEDPVEYKLPGITQMQVNPRIDLTFAQGLRSIIRSDPDVIMVGEMRDSEAARIAIESALTGHLVLTTMHTNDAPTAMSRLTEMGIEPFLSASAVDCVISQRLARV